DPDRHDAFELLARWFPREALEALSRLDPSAVSDAGVLLNAVLLLEEAGLQDALLRYARRLLEIMPGAGIALRILLRGDPASAVPGLRDRAEGRPRDAEAWAALGTALLASGRRAEAFESFRRAAQIDPAAPEYFQGLIETDPWAAVEALRPLAEAHPDNPEAVGKLGRALAASGRRDEALPSLLEALRLEPEDPEWMDLLLEIDPARTASALRGMLEKRPDDDVLNGQLGRAFLAAGDRGGAFEAYRRAFRNRNGDWLWAEAMGGADPERAVPLLEEALGYPAARLAGEARSARPGEPGEPWAGEPNLEPAQCALAGVLGQALVRSGRLADGEALIEFALRTRDEDPDLRARLLGTLGRANPARAAALLRELEKEAEEDADAWGRIAEAWQGMDNEFDALWAYRRALALEPTNEEWITAVRKLVR
ncbi:MAG: tetratricopeptide repeat protein, partial [Planctomycetes bacterium]|nr:tetratricopeptide repeat protein [Planctomycetota bacterium]